MPDKMVFAVEGDFDAAAVQDMRPKLNELADLAEGDLVLDLTGVTFMDSSGIGAIAFLYKRLVAHHRGFSVRGLSGQPREVFAHLGMDRAVKMED